MSNGEIRKSQVRSQIPSIFEVLKNPNEVMQCRDESEYDQSLFKWPIKSSSVLWSTLLVCEKNRRMMNHKFMFV